MPPLSAKESPSFLAQDRGHVLLAAIWPVSALATLAVLGRFMSRKLMRVAWGIDDFTVVGALVLSWGCSVCSTLCVHYGIGKHLDAVSPSDILHFWKTLYAYNQIYVATGPTIKIAVLLMYRRIFATPLFKRAVSVLGSLVLMWYLAEALSGVFTCRPVQGYWDKTLDAKCINLKSYDIGYAVVNIGLDIVILILPVRMIWSLKTTLGQKVALTFAFLLGGFACITALIRLLTAILHVNDPDFTWIYTDALIWTAVEPAVGVISACLPTLRPVLVFFLPKRFALSAIRSSNLHPRIEASSKSGRSWPSGKYFSRLDDHSLATVIDNDDSPLKNTLDDGPGRSAPADNFELEDGIKTTIESGDSGRERFEDGIMVTTDMQLHAM